MDRAHAAFNILVGVGILFLINVVFFIAGVMLYGVVTKTGLDVQVGQIHGVGDMNMAVTSITNQDSTQSITGYWVNSRSEVDREVVISAPGHKLTAGATVDLSRADRKFMNSTAEEAFTNTLENLDNKATRLANRRYQLAAAINREVTAATTSKAMRRRFLLGVACLELDLPILQLHPFRMRNKQMFAYKTANLSGLDSLLGSHWDVRPGQGQVIFVTQLVLGLSASNILSGSVAVASYRGDLSLDRPYRHLLMDHIHATEVGQEELELEIDPLVEESDPVV